MITRREYMKLCSAAGVALALRPELLWAGQGEQKVIMREIPGKNEALPVVGLNVYLLIWLLKIEDILMGKSSK